MKQCKYLFLFLLFISVGAEAQLPIIPYPNKVETGKGFFKLTKSAASTAKLIVDPQTTVVASMEGYHLSVTPTAITITAKTKVGAFYGMQTLLQLEAQSKNIPVLEIDDAPAFGYRGLMLDVGRHFMPVSFIKQLIDVMAMQKMNNLHLHLTEDQGWRIEIKKYPKLTSVGSVRGGTLIGKYPGKGNTNAAYGGFYTQAQLKDLVAYAAAKHINIIPEIEMPGHASAAIAAYPELSCFPNEPTQLTKNMYATATENKIKNQGGKIVQESWGVFDDVFAPSEYTFNFIENVLDEVMDIFPSKLSKLSNEITISTDISIDDNLDLELEYEFDNYYIELHKQLAEKIKTPCQQKNTIRILIKISKRLINSINLGNLIGYLNTTNEDKWLKLKHVFLSLIAEKQLKKNTILNYISRIRIALNILLPGYKQFINHAISMKTTDKSDFT